MKLKRENSAGAESSSDVKSAAGEELLIKVDNAALNNGNNEGGNNPTINDSNRTVNTDGPNASDAADSSSHHSVSLSLSPSAQPVTAASPSKSDESSSPQSSSSSSDSDSPSSDAPSSFSPVTVTIVTLALVIGGAIYVNNWIEKQKRKLKKDGN